MHGTSFLYATQASERLSIAVVRLPTLSLPDFLWLSAVLALPRSMLYAGRCGFSATALLGCLFFLLLLCAKDGVVVTPQGTGIFVSKPLSQLGLVGSPSDAMKQPQDSSLGHSQPSQTPTPASVSLIGLLNPQFGKRPLQRCMQ